MQLPPAFILTPITRDCVGAHRDARNAARSRPHRLHLVVSTLEPLVSSASKAHPVHKPRNFTTIPPISTQHSYISLLLTHPHADQRTFTHPRTLLRPFTLIQFTSLSGYQKLPECLPRLRSPTAGSPTVRIASSQTPCLQLQARPQARPAHHHVVRKVHQQRSSLTSAQNGSSATTAWLAVEIAMPPSWAKAASAASIAMLSTRPSPRPPRWTSRSRFLPETSVDMRLVEKSCLSTAHPRATTPILLERPRRPSSRPLWSQSSSAALPALALLTSFKRRA